ncbi:spermatogenesis-associated protein 25 isoform X1 [Sorex araneus]|uniref:spermatogenesis-associated protein 25 isoform X1 n=1 Tax=Sorex araneus TaxID=42254 RepID=UPI00243392C1|nr:spermatogenesis-associated protein 25 isoform X1 [Sorex araneus]
MSCFMAPQSHLSVTLHLLPVSAGGAAMPSSSFGPSGPAEPAMVAPGGLAPRSQQAEQVTPAWGPVLTMPEARGCPGGASWEPLRQESGRYGPKLPPGRQPERLGWEDACSGSRGPPRGAPRRPGPLLLCGLSPGVLPVASEAGGKEASPQPDICILTLAMMIAGIPTVPVPGLREEDLIRAAQTFMMAHPEPEGPVEGARWVQERAHPAPGHTSLVRPKRGQPPGSYL